VVNVKFHLRDVTYFWTSRDFTRSLLEPLLDVARLAAFAFRMTVRSRGLNSGSFPPSRTAIVISLLRMLNIFHRLASTAA
jgi:hypothetical protein